jgi:DegV family protein with EDD domain
MTDSPQRIALITDSTSDMRDVAAAHHIYVVPQIIIWGTEELKDGVDIQPEGFYRRLESDDRHPTTSQPSATHFVEMLEQAQTDGAEEALIITLSKDLSGTYDSAVQAADQVDMPVTVVDSRSVTWGCGFQVMAAHRARQAGGDVAAMLAAAEHVRQTAVIYLSLDTLDYLHKGGRIGGAARLVGTALQLKPMLKVDTAEGRVEPVEKTRTRRKALQRLYDVFTETMDLDRPLHIAVLHGAAPDLAEEYAQRVQSELNPVEMHITQVAPVIGVHTGPGAVALCGYNE